MNLSLETLWFSTVAWVYVWACQPGQETFSGSCYQLLTQVMTWDDGNAACSDIGGSLTAPNSSAENQFIWDMFFSNVRGLRCWIGCKRDTPSGNWVRAADGALCTYFNWYLVSGPQDSLCPYMSRWDGTWDDWQCTELYYPICKIHPPSPTTLPTTSCPRAYTYSLSQSHCLTGRVIKELSVKGFIACGLACLKEPRCRSFNLRQVSEEVLLCQLNDITHHEADKESLDQDPTCQHYQSFNI